MLSVQQHQIFSCTSSIIIAIPPAAFSRTSSSIVVPLPSAIPSLSAQILSRLSFSSQFGCSCFSRDLLLLGRTRGRSVEARRVLGSRPGVFRIGLISPIAAVPDSWSMEPPQQQQHVVVCGGGVIGVCTAYFLGKKGVRVTLVEKSGVACAASGKAGGFLALDMCDGSVLRGLARASFGLHESLAEELGGESYGYRRIHALGLGIEEVKGAAGYPSKGHAKASIPTWVDGPVSGGAKPVGNPKTLAQVHPQLFTQAVFTKAVEKYGVSLVIGKVEEVKLAGNQVTGVVVDGKVIAADTVVVAMGPWSGENYLVSSLTSISGLKAHSIVVRPKQPDAISPHALFLSYWTKEGKVLDPEIYPRPRGEVYVCGMTEEVGVPDDPQQIIPRPEATAMLQRVAGTVSSALADAEIEVAQACFLPCSEDGVPVIGKIPDVDGAYVATGHSCWGILNAPATGASLADLIVDGVSTTVDLKPFDPLRFCVRASRSR